MTFQTSAGHLRLLTNTIKCLMPAANQTTKEKCIIITIITINVLSMTMKTTTRRRRISSQSTSTTHTVNMSAMMKISKIIMNSAELITNININSNMRHPFLRLFSNQLFTIHQCRRNSHQFTMFCLLYLQFKCSSNLSPKKWNLSNKFRHPQYLSHHSNNKNKCK